MPNVIGATRRLVFAPSLAEVSLAGRKFPVTSSAATRRRLDAIPQSVVCGFEWGIETRHQWELERRLDMVDAELRGFAYEGATMALTIRDAMGPRRGTRTRDLLLGPGAPHIFLAYIGMGFAMARLPRPLWKKVLPDLSPSPYHPTMSWLAVDGYGFDRAYFDTRRWVDRQEVPKAYPWEGRPDYFPRAIDQGIGRALWFIHGAQVADVASAVAGFAESRQPDLWSGVGLAATFAGGAGSAAFASLRHLAGDRWPELAQGVVFAAKARSHAGFVPEHTHACVSALTDLSVEGAVALGDSTAVAADAAGPLPPYEQWRTAIREYFAGRAERLTG